MDITAVLKTKFYEKFRFVDALIKDLDERSKELEETMSEMTQTHKKGEDITELAVKARKDNMYLMLIQESLKGNYEALNFLYDICLLTEVDLGLVDKDKERLEYMSEMNKELFVFVNGKIQEAEPMMFEIMNKGIEDKKEFITQQYIEYINNGETEGDKE